MFPVRCSDTKDNWKCIAEKIKKNASFLKLPFFLIFSAIHFQLLFIYSITRSLNMVSK